MYMLVWTKLLYELSPAYLPWTGTLRFFASDPCYKGRFFCLRKTMESWHGFKAAWHITHVDCFKSVLDSMEPGQAV